MARLDAPAVVQPGDGWNTPSPPPVPLLFAVTVFQNVFTFYKIKLISWIYLTYTTGVCNVIQDGPLVGTFSPFLPKINLLQKVQNDSTFEILWTQSIP